MFSWQAAKLDPHNSETFEYLGHYYSEAGRDVTRARKCYQKAFDLDNKNETAGEKLCDLLNKAGEEVSIHGTKFFALSFGRGYVQD